VAPPAKELSAAQGRNYVGTEHPVMALFAMGDAALKRLFTKYGVTLEQFQGKVAELLGC
jgi:ATP-dependent Clp protease ATP-binding subunit ClpA